MADGVGNISAGFTLDVSTNVAGLPADALGLGAAQLQAVSQTLSTVAPVQEDFLLHHAAQLASAQFIATPSAFTQPAIQSGPTKLFVGSIPGGTTQQMMSEEFGKFGRVAEVFLKNDSAEPGRMWGFVTFVYPDSAAKAVAGMNEQFIFPGAQRPLAVSFARSSSSNSAPIDGGAALAQVSVNPTLAPAPVSISGPTKLFIGSIPAGTTKQQIIEEFGKFGAVMDVFLKQDGAEPQRMWGFVTYDNASAASAAVSSLHERLVLPGGSRPCAVSFARNSQAQHSMAAQNLATSVVYPTAGATKLFIGTIPVGTSEVALRVEFEKYGQVTEIFLKNDATDPNRMWGFLSYAEPQSAAVAVSALHEKLMMPGSVRPLAVSFAKTDGKGPRAAQVSSAFDTPVSAALAPLPALNFSAVPELPSSPWKVYYTAQGLPYYHNALAGITQWECPPDYPGGPAAVLADPASLLAVANAQAQTAAVTAATAATSLNPSLGVLGVTAPGFSPVQVAASPQQRFSPY